MNPKIRGVAGMLADSHEQRWINWRYEMRDGKRTKVPKLTSGYGNAKPNDPSTWSTLEQVLDAMDQVDGGSFDGIGIMFDDSKTLLGVDIDHCIVDGEVSPEIAAIIQSANTYTEVSPSGEGLHLYLKLSAPLTLERNRSGSFECYTTGRWFTVTGNEWKTSYAIRTVTPEEAVSVLRLMGYPWKKGVPQLTLAEPKIVSKKTPLSDDAILSRMFASKNGAKIKALYDGDTSEYGGDESAADSALCFHLAFWTGKDAEKIEALWLSSPLGAREKTQKRKDYRGMTIRSAIENTTETYTAPSKDESEEDDTTRTSQATQIATLVMNDPQITLFLDQYRAAHVRMPVDDHFEIWPCASSDFGYWLSNEYFTRYGKAVGTNTLSAALNAVQGKARASGLRYTLHNRIAEADGAIWYDLGDEKWRAVRITMSGWSVVNDPPILFRRHSYHEAQIEPVPGGDIRELLRFVNVKEPEQQLLLLTYLIAAYIPGFPHPLLYVHGQQGAAKTSLLETCQALVDPSAIGCLSLPRNLDDLKQTLHHHSALASFDNVTGIDSDTADLLCRAVTGAGFSKRKLYSDNETIIYRVRANVAVNGINLGSSRPDLLERCILMELTRINEGERRQYAELQKAFAEARPRILGAIFDAVVLTLSIRPNIQLDELSRMADFMAWGSAIAVSIGFNQEAFLDAYEHNVDAQNMEVLENNVVGKVIIELVEEAGRWEGTASALLQEIKFNAPKGTDEKQLPKDGNGLTRKMRFLTPALEAAGITWFRDRGHERMIVIRKIDAPETAEAAF